MTYAPNNEWKAGTISQVLATNIMTHVENDGDHQYLHILQESKNQLPLFSETQQIMMPLTNCNVDITQFDKSFITMLVKVRFKVDAEQKMPPAQMPPLQLSEDEKTGMPPEKVKEINDTLANMEDGIRLLIGYKNSADCIKSRSVYHKGKLVNGTLQDNASTESFMYHALRAEQDLTYRRAIYSIAESIDKCDVSSISGNYVSLKQLCNAIEKSNGYLEQSFRLIIPFNDVMCFQAFQEFPNVIFGDLELYFTFNKDSLVVKQCDPVKPMKAYAEMYLQDLKDEDLKTLTQYINEIDGPACYCKEYTQIGDKLSMVTGITREEVKEDDNVTDIKNLGLSIGDITLTPQSIQIDEVYSTIIGCKMNQVALEEERQRYVSTPFVEFTQNLNFTPFSQNPTSNGIDIIQQVYLKNVTDFMFTFPRSTREITVFKNPMLEEFTINTMGRNCPEQPLDFTSSRFAAIMMNASDTIDGSVRREYGDSISIDRAGPDGLIKPDRDLTSFITTIQLERPSAMGVAFDGLDSHGQSVSIRMKAKYKYKNHNDYKSYDGQLPPPPVLYTLNDAYWIFSSRNGGECIYSDNNFNQTVASFIGGVY